MLPPKLEDRTAMFQMKKLAEGWYNKVFRLLMDDGKTVNSTHSKPNAGPPFYSIASEVAAMELGILMQLLGPNRSLSSRSSCVGNSCDKLTPDSKALDHEGVSLSQGCWNNARSTMNAGRGPCRREMA
ncbi:hypothetical protein V1525DRAFT_459312 [Lipomyces kononenkoae]|uniref:Uncharacterized protein n=1 Tax=Lipomyces kononenkoae TaxID=34357 RepID=A0ACC3SSF7_LIPKO